MKNATKQPCIPRNLLSRKTSTLHCMSGREHASVQCIVGFYFSSLCLFLSLCPFLTQICVYCKQKTVIKMETNISVSLSVIFLESYLKDSVFKRSDVIE